MTALLDAESRWECQHCEHKQVLRGAVPGAVIHKCRGLAGVIAPLTPAGTRCRVRVFEREDYVAGETVQTNGYGRPIMSVVTEREDGQDCLILAPLATGGGKPSGVDRV